MTIERWLSAATTDARSRGLNALVPLLEGLAQSLTVLRHADFNGAASGESERRDAIQDFPSDRHPR